MQKCPFDLHPPSLLPGAWAIKQQKTINTYRDQQWKALKACSTDQESATAAHRPPGPMPVCANGFYLFTVQWESRVVVPQNANRGSENTQDASRGQLEGPGTSSGAEEPRASRPGSVSVRPGHTHRFLPTGQDRSGWAGPGEALLTNAPYVTCSGTAPPVPQEGRPRPVPARQPQAVCDGSHGRQIPTMRSLPPKGASFTHTV